MQEILLHGLVPDNRYTQILSILAGLTATPSPLPILERHHIFKPSQAAPPSSQQSFQSGASQDVDQGKRVLKETPVQTNRLLKDLVEDMTLEGNDHADDEHGGEARWTVVSSDLPEPGFRNAISRRRDIMPLSLTEVGEFTQNDENLSVSQYLLEGNLFVHGNIVLRLQRCLRFKPWDASPGTGLTDLKTELVDRSGAWMLEARVRIADGAEREVTGRAVEELGRLKEVLDGVIELRVAERLSLDGRAR